jgi:hypothetical protein
MDRRSACRPRFLVSHPSKREQMICLSRGVVGAGRRAPDSADDNISSDCILMRACVWLFPSITIGRAQFLGRSSSRSHAERFGHLGDRPATAVRDRRGVIVPLIALPVMGSRVASDRRQPRRAGEDRGTRSCRQGPRPSRAARSLRGTRRGLQRSPRPRGCTAAARDSRRLGARTRACRGSRCWPGSRGSSPGCRSVRQLAGAGIPGFSRCGAVRMVMGRRVPVRPGRIRVRLGLARL